MESKNGRRLTTVAQWIGLGAAGMIGGYLTWRTARRLQVESANRHLTRGKTIVVLGTGFAGLAAARELARLLPGEADGRILLIDERDFLLFTPMLTEVAGGTLDPHHVVRPVHLLSPRIDFLQGRVERIDAQRREVTVTIGAGTDHVPTATRVVRADHIIIALGSVANFRGTPGAEEFGMPLKGLLDAARLRNRALALLMRASEEDDPQLKQAMLTFVVAGGGYTGVEAMAALNDLIRDESHHFGSVPAEQIRTILASPGDRLMPELTPELAAFAQRKLEERGVEVRLRTKVTAVGEDFVQFSPDERIPAYTTVWAAGVMPNPVVTEMDLPHGKHGGLPVDGTMAVPGYPGLWALGDCAEVPDGADSYAPTAQNATREGVVVARNVVAVLRGEEAKPFRYRPIGELALVGKHSGVARVYGIEFSGLPAWAMWRAVYWAKMPGLAQRTRIGVDWLLDFVFGRNVVVMPGARTSRTLPVPPASQPNEQPALQR